MNLEDAHRRALVWMEAAESHLFVVAFEDDDLFFTESPEEQGLKPEEPQEYLVRIFMTRTEASRYMDTVVEHFPEMKFIVRTFSNFEALWPTLMGTHETFVSTVSMPVRAALSRMAADAWPQTIDTVYSSHVLRN